MGVRTTLLGITPLSTEVATCAEDGQDLNGMLNFAAEKVADAIQVLNAIKDFLPTGTNLTTIETEIAALT